MISTLGAFWKIIASDLGIEVVAPFLLLMPNGTEIEIDALVRNFGAKNGMLVVENFSRIRDATEEMEEMGYGYSTLDAPKVIETYDVEIYIDILSDWGWTGAEADRPRWMKEP